MIYKLAFPFLFLIQITVHAQQEVTIENDLQITGNLTLGQDLSQDSVAGMMRWDTVSMTFQGYTGSEWISFISPSPSEGTDTLEVGDSYGGGIVFFTSGSHGLIVTDFDLGLPANIITTEIPWGPSSPSTGATSDADGASNTAAIVSSVLDTYNNGGYAAKVCDDFDHGGFDDWYLPSIIEYQTIDQALGSSAAAPLTNLANFTDQFYWTSTEVSTNQAKLFNPGNTSLLVTGKTVSNYVRAIRAY